MGKEIGFWLWKPLSCKPSLICVIPLVRGDCGYPSSERLIVEVVLVSLLVKRWIVLLVALCLSLICEVDLFGFVPIPHL